MTTIRLVACDGDLAFPTGGFQGEPSILIYDYPAGDIDVPSWPMDPDDPHAPYRLAVALFDERECNDTFPDNAVIELPDGTVFDFDSIAAQPCPYEP